MTEREAFESWASMPPRNWHTGVFPEGHHLAGEYQSLSAQRAWEGWQARADVSTHKAIYEDEACGE